MGIWIEIHCDKQGPKCRSHGGDYGPSGFSESSKEKVAETVGLLKHQASTKGWKWRGKYLICPNCLNEG